MPTSPSINIALSITGANIATGKLGSVDEDFNIQSLYQLLPGTGAGQADTLFEDTRTLAASANETLVFSGGTVATRFSGIYANLLHIKAILIRASAGNTNNVQVGGAANPWSGPFGGAVQSVIVQPGEIFLMTAATGAGWPLVVGASDSLKITNSGAGTPVSYDIFILGTST